MSQDFLCSKIVPPAFGILFALLSALAASAQSNEFTLPEGCRLPFDAIATKPDPFQCGNCGVVSTNPKEAQPKALQSQAKNNFCAGTAAVTIIDFATLRSMQTTSKTKGWVVPDLASRQMLHGFFKLNGKAIGEGTVVRLQAWVLEAHISDCAGGESVNCEKPGFLSNDIHIPLLDPTAGGRNQDECSSVTAEMSPHFRPAVWSQLDMKTPVKNVVRVTGPLFFDNAHDACAGLRKTSSDTAPLRSSLWEIHPVYQFEVCANIDPSQCDVNTSDSSVWIPYDQWVKKAAAQATQATGQTQRNEKSCKQPTAKPTGNVPAQCPNK